MPSTHTVFVSEYVLGPNETAALEGAKGSPLLTTGGGGKKNVLTHSKNTLVVSR